MTCGEKEICVENSQCPHPDKTPETSERIFDEMKEAILKLNEPRYILFDFSYTRNSGGFKDVPIYIFWCPDCTGIKQKMKYASSSEYLKKAFSGIQHF
ncbi:hypothetical protein OS493_031381 [Desmophyllum pertusum]|uniref:ADF-H domain-containing protein n=1 Tax=Desmophyllum pertusum TaxID=174260 RepID=A0A9W9Y8F9_9CNID|nr:hypothetical protein OS493_031381 [Desmophyllum pertusum]